MNSRREAQQRGGILPLVVLLGSAARKQICTIEVILVLVTVEAAAMAL